MSDRLKSYLLIFNAIISAVVIVLVFGMFNQLSQIASERDVFVSYLLYGAVGLGALLLFISSVLRFVKRRV